MQALAGQRQSCPAPAQEHTGLVFAGQPLAMQGVPSAELKQVGHEVLVPRTLVITGTPSSGHGKPRAILRL